MKRIKSIKKGPRRPTAPDAIDKALAADKETHGRTVVPHGDPIRAARRNVGMTQADVVVATHDFVEARYKLEKERGLPGRFHRRYVKRCLLKQQLAGVSKNTISKMERGGKPVYVFSLFLVAKVLDVPVESLIMRSPRRRAA